ncbi:MAG: peptidylprolyl isomerase [Chitinophagaceae bacterium]
MKKIIFSFLLGVGVFSAGFAQGDSTLKKKDRKRDVSLQTSQGEIVIRLSDLTPLHRDNFLKLVKMHYYDGILFHRVIRDFMIQAGDPNSREAKPGQRLGNGGPGYTIPAEIRDQLFHKKGVIAAARMGDDVNPDKASSGSQFYLAQGKIFTDEELDKLEQTRMKGKKIPASIREVYKTVGGIPHLDMNYTVYGEVIRGIDVVDKIAAVPTSKGVGGDRPIEDVKIINARLVKRKRS